MGIYKEGKAFRAMLEDIAKDKIEHIGRDRYNEDYSAEVDNELDDLVQYPNISMVTFPLYKTISQIPHEPFEILPNGRPVYSLVMYLAGLTEFDRVADNKLKNPFYKGWAFKHIKRMGKSYPRLGLEFQVTSSFMQDLKDTVAKLSEEGKDKALFQLIRDCVAKKYRPGEYWLGDDVLFREDKELDFLKQLQEESGLSVSVLGLPDNYDMIMPSGFEIPREVESRPVRSMFREDAYEMIKSLYPFVSDEAVFNLVEYFRLGKPLEDWLFKTLKIADVDDDFLEDLREIRYFPSRLNMVGRYIISWRLEQYKKNVPDIYYKYMRAMLKDSGV